MKDTLSRLKISDMKNIVLVGFMGTGKTAVAKLLARRLKMHYVCVDDLIEKHEGHPITDIFSASGEEYFRKIESEIIRDISDKSGQVIDAGGGAVLKEENVKNLKKNGILVCLTATPDVIYDRIKSQGTRPLLNVLEPKKKIQELLLKRAQYYAKADFTIDTSDLTVEQAVEKIKKILQA